MLHRLTALALGTQDMMVMMDMVKAPRYTLWCLQILCQWHSQITGLHKMCHRDSRAQLASQNGGWQATSTGILTPDVLR